MNINLSGWNYNRAIQSINRQQSLLNILFHTQKSKNNGMRDMFVRTGSSFNDIGLYTKDMGLYTADASEPKVGDRVSDAILDMINFEYSAYRLQADGSYVFGDVKYLKEEIPSVSLDRCLEAKAENNAIVFQTGKYYKFTDENGKTHVLCCSNSQLHQPYSDTSRGIVDDTSYNIGKFWSMLASNGTYIGLYYSIDTERKFLNDAGVTEGFFSVQAGDSKQEYYYSNGVAGVAVPKWRYDNTYNMFMTQNDIVFRDYEPGAVFKIGVKEYVLSADRKLDIPYGADIYDIEYPPRNKC